MALICILVFNLESYEYFRPVFVEVLCHSFMRYAKVIFFLVSGKLPPVRVRVSFGGGGNFPRTIFLYEIVEIVQEDLLARKVYYRIYYRISFFTLTHVPSDEQIPYYRKHVSPSFSKIGNLQVFALYLAKFLSLEYA